MEEKGYIGGIAGWAHAKSSIFVSYQLLHLLLCPFMSLLCVTIEALSYLLCADLPLLHRHVCLDITHTYITLRKLAIASIFELQKLISFFHTHLTVPEQLELAVFYSIHLSMSRHFAGHTHQCPDFIDELCSSFMCRNCPVLLNPSHPSPVIKQHIFTFALHIYSFVFLILFTNNLYTVVTSHLILF